MRTHACARSLKGGIPAPLATPAMASSEATSAVAEDEAREQADAAEASKTKKKKRAKAKSARGVRRKKMIKKKKKKKTCESPEAEAAGPAAAKEREGETKAAVAGPAVEESEGETKAAAAAAAARQAAVDVARDKASAAFQKALAENKRMKEDAQRLAEAALARVKAKAKQAAKEETKAEKGQPSPPKASPFDARPVLEVPAAPARAAPPAPAQKKSVISETSDDCSPSPRSGGEEARDAAPAQGRRSRSCSRHTHGSESSSHRTERSKSSAQRRDRSRSSAQRRRRSKSSAQRRRRSHAQRGGRSRSSAQRGGRSGRERRGRSRSRSPGLDLRPRATASPSRRGLYRPATPERRRQRPPAQPAVAEAGAAPTASIDNLVFGSYVFGAEASKDDAFRLFERTPAHVSSVVVEGNERLCNLLEEVVQGRVTCAKRIVEVFTGPSSKGYLMTHPNFVNSVAKGEESVGSSHAFGFATVTLKDPQPAVAVGVLNTKPCSDDLPTPLVDKIRQAISQHEIRFLGGMFPRDFRAPLFKMLSEEGVALSGPWCQPFQFGQGNYTWPHYVAVFGQVKDSM